MWGLLLLQVLFSVGDFSRLGHGIFKAHYLFFWN